MNNLLGGMTGVPIKVDKLGMIGKVDDVIKNLKEISKDMENPMIIRLDDTIAVFDLKPLPEIKMPPISNEILKRKVLGPFDFLPTAQEASDRMVRATKAMGKAVDAANDVCAELDPKCGA